ncbi:Alpha/beta hydrolase family protein [Crateriforma conspicua]|uniref:Alpha/beta hydrolase family protein n=2 Tax=Crateriforma conspicua TaxID=2527996 RepID=A0A5C5Y6E8_9PLAN|nr:Alpha/beta hydrolase family protein [Crateriforma conspicua]TWT69835.1 Alpha/beta hydrolase family protein [Crateriforma conspicua]
MEGDFHPNRGRPWCRWRTDRDWQVPHRRAWACRQRWPLIWLAVFLAAGPGCSTTKYLVDRNVRDNPLSRPLNLMRLSGPKVSDRTWSTLRRYGLESNYQTDCRTCLSNIRRLIHETPDPELVYALSELAYVEGKKSERAGEVSDALNHYGIALTNSYDYLFSDAYVNTRNPYDPQFRSVCNLYNESLEDTLRLLCRENRFQPGQTYTIRTPEREFIVRTEMRGAWKPSEFERYEFVSDYDIQTLRNRHTTYGLGVPLIAVRRAGSESDHREGYYPEGLSYAVTAMMRCPTPREDRKPGETPVCVLEFFDPLQANQIQLANHWVPLETDLTTPLAFFLDSPEYRERDRPTLGLVRPNMVEENRGIFMLEPYDPNRIPVLMVHGLWSSPITWMDMFNDLRSFPEIRERYQFWFYLYPSGQPFWLSATQLRTDLAEMRQTFDPMGDDRPLDDMVLVGHSMGGLLSRFQTIESEDKFWKIISDRPPEELQGPEDQKAKLVSAMFFHPNQSVSRVITIGTPHRGSDFANSITKWLGETFIKLPNMAMSVGRTMVGANPGLFRNSHLLTEATAIDSLAPESPIFEVMLAADRSPQTRYHNIIGVLKDPPLIVGSKHKGDGVVEYASATMNDVESELVVDADHVSLHMTGQAIFEVRRILLKHLQEFDAKNRVALQTESGPGSNADPAHLATPIRQASDISAATATR